jgi:hypothetical protein
MAKANRERRSQTSAIQDVWEHNSSGPTPSRKSGGSQFEECTNNCSKMKMVSGRAGLARLASIGKAINPYCDLKEGEDIDDLVQQLGYGSSLSSFVHSLQYSKDARGASRTRKIRNIDQMKMLRVLDILGNAIDAISFIDGENLGTYELNALAFMMYCEAEPKLAALEVPYQSVDDIIKQMVGAYVDAFAV